MARKTAELERIPAKWNRFADKDTLQIQWFELPTTFKEDRRLRHGRKVEGMSPPRLQASTCGRRSGGNSGSKPGARLRGPFYRRTQRFPPGASSSRRMMHPPLAIEGAWVLMPKGPARDSREAGALSFPSSAGAANQPGHFETLSTMSPPFRVSRWRYNPITRNESRIIFADPDFPCPHVRRLSNG